MRTQVKTPKATTTTTATPKKRGRPAKTLGAAKAEPQKIEPHTTTKQPREEDVRDTFSLAPSGTENPSNIEGLEGVVFETLEKTALRATQPDAPAVKEDAPKARLRTKTRENVFQTQRAVLEPNEALLEHFRAHPNPHPLRDLLRDLDEVLLERLGGKRGLETTLEQLVRANRLTLVRRQVYGLAQNLNLVTGRFEIAQGGGYVVPETPGMDTIYIPKEDAFTAWHGDRIVARKRRQRGTELGEVSRILERARDKVIGTLEYRRGYAMLRADWSKLPRVALLPTNTENLAAGARLEVQLHWPEVTGEDEPYGEILNVLGTSDSPEVETRAVIEKFELQDAFSEAVLLEAEKIPSDLNAAALAGRTDLRNRRSFTIDGRDAKDFDDAIHIEPLRNGHFLVGVHIADVSHYVTEGSKLDTEARSRATSVYLPGRVLPMLPEKLSNGVCSLVPDQDRLTVSVLVEMTSDGSVVNYALVNSVIHSRARLTYNEVQAFADGKASLHETHRELEGDLHLLLKLTANMRAKRFEDGSLDFKLREVRVELENGTPTLTLLKEETARGLIEDLMLLANKIVATHLVTKNAPALFRVHEEPNEARFQEVLSALSRMGVKPPENANPGEPSPQLYQAILASVRGTALEQAVNTLLLRSMKQARYSSRNLGHFGLAFGDYLHFTSPIRRYPDLIVHRVLKWLIAGRLSVKKRETLQADMPTLGEHASKQERNASEAERDLGKYYHCKWAEGRLGQAFKAWVSGLLPSGLFLALENGVEGFLPLEALSDDEYSFLSEAQMLKGRRTGRHFRLGTPLWVRIVGVQAVARRINLEPKEKAVMTKQHKTGGQRNRPTTNHQSKRAIVLGGRNRPDYPRPVKVTARKLFFGEWSRENFEDDEAQNGAPRPTQSNTGQRHNGPRGNGNTGNNRRNHEQRHGEQRSSDAARGGQQQRPEQTRGRDQHNPRNTRGPANQQGRNQTNAQASNTQTDASTQYNPPRSNTNPARSGQNNPARSGQSNPARSGTGNPARPSQNSNNTQRQNHFGQNNRNNNQSQRFGPNEDAIARNAERARRGPLEGGTAPTQSNTPGAKPSTLGGGKQPSKPQANARPTQQNNKPAQRKPDTAAPSGPRKPMRKRLGS